MLFFLKKFYVVQVGVLKNYYFFLIKKPVSRQENIQIVLCFHSKRLRLELDWRFHHWSFTYPR